MFRDCGMGLYTTNRYLRAPSLSDPWSETMVSKGYSPQKHKLIHILVS